MPLRRNAKDPVNFLHQRFTGVAFCQTVRIKMQKNNICLMGWWLLCSIFMSKHCSNYAMFYQGLISLFSPEACLTTALPNFVHA